jgi:RNA polymerase sigma-70 factor (ECF subfamily)
MITATLYLHRHGREAPEPIALSRDAAGIVAHAAELCHRAHSTKSSAPLVLSPQSLLVALLTCPSDLRSWIRESFATLGLRHLPLLDELDLPASALRPRGDVAAPVPRRVAETPIDSAILERGARLALTMNAAHRTRGVVGARHVAFALMTLDDADLPEILRSLGVERNVYSRLLAETLKETHPAEASDWHAAYDIEFGGHEQAAIGGPELARRARALEPPAAAEVEPVLRRHAPLLFRVVRGIVSDAVRAEGVVRNALLAAARDLGEFDPDLDFRTWLARRAVEGARSGLETGTDERLTHPPPSVQVAAGTLSARLEDAVDGLPGSERAVLALRSVAGLSEAQVASCLGLTPHAVGLRWHAAKRLLQETLSLDDAVAAEDGLPTLFQPDLERVEEIVASVLRHLEQRSSGIRPTGEADAGDQTEDELEDEDERETLEMLQRASGGDALDLEVDVVETDSPPEAAERTTRRSWLPFGKRSA